MEKAKANISDMNVELENRVALLVKAFNNRNVTAEKIKGFMLREAELSSEEEEESFEEESSTECEESSGEDTEVESNKSFTVVERGKRKSSSPAKTVKRSKITEKINTNQFSILDNEMEVVTEVNKTKESSSAVLVNSSKYQPPPITCYRLNVAHLQRHVQSLVPRVDYKIMNYNKSKSIIRPVSRKDHEIITAYLKEQQIDSFSYSFKEDKSQVAVLKGVHHSYSTNEIKEELIKIIPKQVITSVSVLKSKLNKSSTFNNFIVKFSSSSRMDDLLSIKYLLNQKIYWEKLKKQEVLQCFRCQHFGHVSRNCQMKPRCVKCKESHVVGSCANDKTDINIPACVNCGETGHPASYRGCPHHKMLVKKIMERKIKKTVNSTVIKDSLISYKVDNKIEKTKSYAEMVRDSNISKPSQVFSKDSNGTKTKNKNINPQEFCTVESVDMFGCDLFSLINKINSFLPTYSKLSIKAERQAAYLKFVFELCAHNT